MPHSPCIDLRFLTLCVRFATCTASQRQLADAREYSTILQYESCLLLVSFSESLPLHDVILYISVDYMCAVRRMLVIQQFHDESLYAEIAFTSATLA